MSESQNRKNFTMIANKSLEAIQRYKFTTNQLKIILVIWRQTYGYQREAHKFSLSYLQKTTNLTRSRISESLKGLIENKILLEVRKGGGQQAKILSFNNNFNEWKIEKYSSVTSCYSNATSLQNDTTTSLQNDTSRGLQDDTKYKESIKEIIKKKERYFDFPIEGSSFLMIYNNYFFSKFKKDHMKVTKKQRSYILEQISIMEELTDEEEFDNIVCLHFKELPKKNDGNILAFIPAFKRHLETVHSN